MASIAEWIQRIKTAIYGEEVRGAIWQSLQAMNDELTSADVTQIPVNKADIATLRTDMTAVQGSVTSLQGDVETAGAEVEDIRVGADGTVYNNAGTAVRGQVSDLKSVNEQKFYGVSQFKFNTINGDVFNIVDFDGLIKGGYIAGQTGVFVPGTSGSGLDCCTDFIPVKADTISIFNTTTVKFNLVQYDSTRTRIASGYFEETEKTINLNNSTAYIRFSFVSSVSGFDNAFVYVQGAVANIVSQKTIWRNGTCNNTSNENGVAFQRIQPTHHATSVTVLIDTPLTDGHKYRFQLNTYSVADGKPESNSSYRITAEKTILIDRNFVTFSLMDGCKGFAIALYEKDENDAYVALRIDTFDTSNVYLIKNYDHKMFDADDYVINTDFIKTKLSCTQIGWVTGIQSFCKYNTKYYSYINNKLYEQNADFSAAGNTTLNGGHGNSLQLGSNGIAYLSGWDDQTVYCIDLTTKTVINTIALPTTGYTTCAVDDVNQIMYIFQRDTSPSTEENYNFIVYDYGNGQIKSTKKITKPFAAMQSCDFVNGKIVVANGLGTISAPNGIRIYNTNGDILAEYVIGTLADVELEGIFIDRETFNVLISQVNGNLYEVEKLY